MSFFAARFPPLVTFSTVVVDVRPDLARVVLGAVQSGTLVLGLRGRLHPLLNWRSSLRSGAVILLQGKGRTGLFVCAYLLYSRASPNAEAAMRHFAQTRFAS